MKTFPPKSFLIKFVYEHTQLIQYKEHSCSHKTVLWNNFQDENPDPDPDPSKKGADPDYWNTAIAAYSINKTVLQLPKRPRDSAL
jgi:hypothetical protein